MMEAKNLAIISYLTIIKLILALVLNNPKQELASFHIRQYLGIFLFGFGKRVNHDYPNHWLDRRCYRLHPNPCILDHGLNQRG